MLARVREIGVGAHVPLQTGKQGDVVFDAVEQRLAEQDFEGVQAVFVYFVYISTGAARRMVLPQSQRHGGRGNVRPFGIQRVVALRQAAQVFGLVADAL